MITKARLPRCAPDARREFIVRKASELFLKEGFAATSMSTVARAVGGSKATLYKYFSTKEALFEAVMEEKSSAVLGPIHSTDSPRDTPHTFLTVIGERLLMGIYDSEAVALYRVVIGDSGRSPEIGQVFFDVGPDRGRAIVENQLEAYNEVQMLRINNPRQATEDFFALLRGETHFRVVAGVRTAPDSIEIKAHVQRVVDLLLSVWSA